MKSLVPLTPLDNVHLNFYICRSRSLVMSLCLTRGRAIVRAGGLPSCATVNRVALQCMSAAYTHVVFFIGQVRTYTRVCLLMMATRARSGRVWWCRLQLEGGRRRA